MPLNSIKALDDLATEAESILERVQRLDLTNDSVRIPRQPIPLTLISATEWAASVEECCKKPRIAESKRLLNDNGIATASIPADVLEDSESITKYVSEIQGLPTEIHDAAFTALGAALTKGHDDAESVVQTYADAVSELSSLDRTNREWLYSLAAIAVANSPNDATEIVAEANDVSHLLIAAEDAAVVVGTPDRIADLKPLLQLFNSAITDLENFCLAEDISREQEVSLAGKPIDTATAELEHAVFQMRRNKTSLEREAQSLVEQYEMIGGQYTLSAATIAELQSAVADLKQALTQRRTELRHSLGESVFEIVDSLSKGKVPTDEVSDNELGAALRRAVECGFQIKVEPPHEDQ